MLVTKWRSLGLALLVSWALTAANGAEILMVGNDADPTSGDDGAVFDHLESLGHSVTYLAGGDSTIADGQEADLIVISSTLGSGSARGKFLGLGVPILNWEEALMDGNTADGNFAMGAGSENGTADPGTEIRILEPSHPLAAGLSGVVELAEDPIPRPHITGPVAPGVISVAAIDGPDAGDIELSPSGFGMHIGTNQNGGNAFVGLMDEVAVWDRSLTFQVDTNNRLTGGEINTIRASGVSSLATQSGLIGYWNFDADDTSSAEDLSPAGNDATLDGVDSSTNVAGPAAGERSIFMEGTQIIDVMDMERPGGEFAYSFWFNADSEEYGAEFDTSDPRVDFFYGNGVDGVVRPHLSANRNGRPVGIYVNADGDINTPIEATVDAFATDEWHHVVINWDGEVGTVFVNGELNNSITLGEASDLLAITAVEIGGELSDGTAATEKVVNFPIQDTGFVSLTDDGLSLFDAAIAWLLDDTPSVPGDFDGDGQLTLDDVNLLSAAVASDGIDLSFDLDGDSNLSAADLEVWAVELSNSYIGDANLDGEFNSGDFVTIFTAGKFEQDVEAQWGDGDWNGDGRFNSGDFVAAFTGGGYEQGPRTATAAVPEPSSLVLTTLGLLLPWFMHRSSVGHVRRTSFG